MFISPIILASLYAHCNSYNMTAFTDFLVVVYSSLSYLRFSSMMTVYAVIRVNSTLHGAAFCSWWTIQDCAYEVRITGCNLVDSALLRKRAHGALFSWQEDMISPSWSCCYSEKRKGVGLNVTSVIVVAIARIAFRFTLRFRFAR